MTVYVVTTNGILVGVYANSEAANTHEKRLKEIYPDDEVRVYISPVREI